MENKNVAVIGLGYVGLPLALLCSKKGYNAYGIDIDKDKMNLLKNGINPLDNLKLNHNLILSEEEDIKKCSIILVCVPTPVNNHNLPDLSPLVSVATMIKKHLKKGHLIIIESSVSPGTIDENIKPILEETLKAGKDFYLAHGPERIDPGNASWCTENIPRVIGACSKDGLKAAYDFYKSIIAWFQEHQHI